MAGLIPFNKMNSLIQANSFNDFYNMLDDFFHDTWSPRSLLNDSFKIDIRENDNEYCVEAELPGIKKEEISLSLNDGKLSITVAQQEKIDESKDNYIHRERRYGSMMRSVYLADVKSEGVQANFKDGILEITIPKDKHPDKSIPIEIQ